MPEILNISDYEAERRLVRMRQRLELGSHMEGQVIPQVVLDLRRMTLAELYLAYGQSIAVAYFDTVYKMFDTER